MGLWCSVAGVLRTSALSVAAVWLWTVSALG